MKKRIIPNVLILTIFTFALTITISAQSSVKKTNLTGISNDGANIVWSINALNEGGTLTISTPSGEVMRQSFGAGDSPIFSLNSIKILEGQYNFEIVLNPVLSAEVKNALKVARTENRGDEVYQNFLKSGIIPQPMRESGTFRVFGGVLYTSADSAVEPSSELKSDSSQTGGIENKVNKSGSSDVPTGNIQTIAEDLSVQGSICVGVDCTPSETFGFDTIRLKENNLRIGFDDTSSSSGFPSNDWQITANDSANGGANKFSIDDITGARIPFTLTAGAPTNSFFMNSSGNIGLGTSTPAVDLHIVNGNTPAMRLEQDISGGFSAQTWDVAGNETNFFIRDITNSSKIPFKIIPNAPTNSLFINSTGNTGFGVTDPTQKIDVAGGIRSRSVGFEFPDGTIQTTAATGSGFGEINTASNVGSTGLGIFKQKSGVDLQFKNLKAGANVSLTATGTDEIEISSNLSTQGPGVAQHILGGEGKIAAFSTIANPTIDYNSFGIGTGGAAGFFTATYSIPYNLNLADQTAAMVTYKIRYRDQDGTGTASNVIIELVGMEIGSGARASTILFNSNTESGTGFQTITVCRTVDTFNFNPSVRGMYINVSVTGTAALQADFRHIQIYKGATCP